MITREELERMTKEQLHATAKDTGLAGYEALNKKELIDAVLSTPVTDENGNISGRDKMALLPGGLSTDMVLLQYNGVAKGSLVKHGKTWSNVSRRTVSRAEAQMLMNEFPGRFIVVR